MDAITIVEIDAAHRLVLSYDEDMYGRSPRDEWDGHLTAFVDCEPSYRDVAYGRGRDVYPPTALYADPTYLERTDTTGGGYRYYVGGLSNATRRMYGLGANPSVRAYVSPTATVERWARIFYGLTVVWDDDAHGFWVVSPDAWSEVMTERAFEGDPGLTPPFPSLTEQTKLIAEERETYRQWAEGEVYQVTAEEAHTLYRMENGAPYIDRVEWERVDSIGAIYRDAERDYTLPDEAGVRRVANDYFAAEFETKEVTA